MSLNTLPYGDSGFAGVRSMQTREPVREGREPTATAANTRIATQINSMLCVSRFAHYVKVIARNLVGASITAEEIEQRLQAWLSNYVNASQSADAESRAKYPLVSGRVAVHALPGRPGSFGCVIHLQPYHQLDDVAATFRMVTDFSAMGART